MSQQVNNSVLSEFREGQTLLRVQNPSDLRGRQLPPSVEVVALIASSNDQAACVELRTAERSAAYQVGDCFRLTAVSRYYVMQP